MDAISDYTSGYEFSGRIIEPKLSDIATTDAAVIVNSIGSRASFRNPIAQSILAGAGAAIQEEVRGHTLIPPGGVVITHAGRLAATRYLFHVVVTGAATRYRADPELILRVTTRCVQLADLLDQPSIAMPAFGTGVGRATKEEVIKRMLNAIIEILPACEALKKIIFAATSERTFALFNNLALADIALARREQELKDTLRDIPPALYGLVGDLLQKLEAARQAGDSPIELQQQAQGLIRIGKELEEKLPSHSKSAGTVQLIVATGGSIVRNVNQQVRG